LFGPLTGALLVTATHVYANASATPLTVTAIGTKPAAECANQDVGGELPGKKMGGLPELRGHGKRIPEIRACS
jgi:hypothetical protein